MKDEYPYKKYYLDIDELVELASRYKPIYINSKDKRCKDIISKNKFVKFVKYKNDYMFIMTDSDSKFYEINQITDYFTEECRVKTCMREKDMIHPFEYFNLYKTQIVKFLESIGKEISFENLNRFMEYSREIQENEYKKPSICTNYKLTYLLGILNHFKPKRWLDMSAGWGDRLCAAYLYGVDYYYGIDPSSCLAGPESINKGYNFIVKYFSSKKYKTQVKIYNGPAEIAPLSDNNVMKYDFIFTSPPFFTFELYDKDSKTQSTNLYKTNEAWLNNFLFVTIDRAWSLLMKGGNYVMYIEDKKEYRFIPKLLQHMRDKSDCKYEGIIYQIFYDKKWVKNPYDVHTVYCWKKI